MTYSQLTKEQSKTLTLLKGFAILLVVMIHCDVRKQMGAELYSGLDLYMQGLTRMIVFNAVPMFFFISGFLFFLKKDTYTNKWKKRVKSLFVPYIIWCLIGFAIPFFFQEVLGLAHLFKGGEGHLKPIADFTGWDYLRMFYDIRDGAPINSVLWFLRNLIVMVAFAPIFHFLATRIKWLFPVILAINYFITGYGILCLSASNLFFFGMGCYLSIHYNGGGISWIENFSIKWLAPVWLLLLLISLAAYRYEFYSDKFSNIFILMDCIIMYKLMSMAVAKWNMDWLMKISVASFFIYLFHEPWLGYFIGMFFKYVHPSGAMSYFMPWFFCAFAVGYSYVAYLILKKIAPKLLSIITGSR